MGFLKWKARFFFGYFDFFLYITLHYIYSGHEPRRGRERGREREREKGGRTGRKKDWRNIWKNYLWLLVFDDDAEGKKREKEVREGKTG